MDASQSHLGVEGLTDGQLVVSSMETPDLFGELFERHAQPVGRFLARRTFGDGTAEDLLAETFLTAFRIRDRFEPARESARPWLFGIATRTAQRSVRDEVRRLRAVARAGSLEMSLAPSCFEDLLIDRVDAARIEPALAAGLAKLRADDRETLLLLAWGELTYAEIAEAQDIPLGTVRSRVFRGRRQLRASLAAHGVHAPSDLTAALGENS